MTIELTTFDWVIGLATLVGSLALGLYLALRAQAGQNSSDFFLAGRRMLWPVVGASYFATNIGAEHLVGLSGDAYRYGLCAGTVEMTTAICLGFACAVLFPQYLRNKIYTIPEFLELRYGPASRVGFSVLMLIICIMTKMAFTLFAAALVLHSLLGWDIMTTVAIIACATALLTMMGGFSFVAYTDTIQATIIFAGCGIMLCMGLYHVGGWGALVERVPEAMHVAKPFDDPTYPFWGIIAGALYGGIFYWGIDQVNVQRALSAKNLNHARWGAMFATLLKLSPIFIFALPGVIAYALYPGMEGDETKQTFVLLLNRLLPSGLRGLVLAALVAALISSLNSVMNSVSTLAVRDFVLRWRPGATERSQVTAGRIAILVSAVLGVAAAYMVKQTQEGLYKYLQTISIYLVLPVTPAIVFGVMSRRVTVAGAYWSVAAGVLVAAVFVFDQLVGAETGARLFPWLHMTLTENYTYRGLWGTLVIIAVLFGVSAVTTKTGAEPLEKTTINWGNKAEAFQGIRDWRLHLTALSAATVAIFIWLW